MRPLADALRVSITMTMPIRSLWIRGLLLSAGAMLLLTGIAKIVSATGHAPLLRTSDPIIGISFRSIFLIVGFAETAVGALCFLHSSLELRAGLVAWLASSFLIYRLGLIVVGYRKPCSCMGTLTEALHISPGVADAAMKCILGYLLVGSYGSLFWLSRQKSKASLSTPSTIAPPSAA